MNACVVILLTEQWHYKTLNLVSKHDDFKQVAYCLAFNYGGLIESDCQPITTRPHPEVS